MVHRALEIFFQEAKQADSLPPVERLQELYQMVLEETYLLHEYYEEFLKRGQKHLAGYYQARVSEFSLNIETEKRLNGITFVLDSGEEIMLTGILDKLEYLPDGTVRVVDYKTGKSWSEKSKEEKERLRRQLVFYRLLLDRYQEGEKKFIMSEGVLEFVEPNKRGLYEQECITVTDRDCELLKQEINEFAQAVLSGAFLQQETKRDRSTEMYTNLLKILQSE